MLGLGGWAASTPHARVAAASTGLRIDAIQATVNAKTLPTQHYDDYSLVFLRDQSFQSEKIDGGECKE